MISEGRAEDGVHARTGPALRHRGAVSGTSGRAGDEETRAVSDSGFKWGGRRDLNPRPLVPQTSALTPELHPPLFVSPCGNRGRKKVFCPRSVNRDF